MEIIELCWYSSSFVIKLARGDEIMRRYIDNRLYDTCSARMIFFRKTDNLPRSNICYEEIAIYRKKTGEYFMFLFKGGKSDIIPLSYEDAKQYVRTYGNQVEFNKAFGIEGEGVTSIRVVVPRSVKAKLDMICSKLGVSQTEFIENCINNFYEGN